ncbi:hypothetical protein OH460_08400 [Vibrio sp. Makdt]|uniref:hypothetical protein n=1 Tax=Vibrio sp. Makdt TaxID=2998828 RepID=UPI0022CD6A4C|nr:hypothetical protein [Vibrio sp. Makdt]MDA0152320.1 hypothetical protein [Vibrio sp. Makdt]
MKEELLNCIEYFEANVNITVPLLNEGNINAGLYALRKATEHGQKVAPIIDTLLTTYQSEIALMQASNLSMHLERNNREKTLKLQLAELVEQNNAQQDHVNECQKTIEEQATSLKNFLLIEKEVQALRKKNPGLLEKELKKATDRVGILEQSKKDDKKIIKTLRQEAKDKASELQVQKKNSIDFIPLSGWIDGRNKDQKYRIIETNDISTIASMGDNSKYSGFVKTDFQLMVEITSGISYKVHVSDWLCPVNPHGIDHNGDYPLKLDTLLKEEFNKRISETYPDLVAVVNSAKNILVEDIPTLTSEDKTILGTANIKSLYECVIFPPELFIGFVRKHNEKPISDEQAKELYDKLHYQGCVLKGDYLLNNPQEISAA